MSAPDVAALLARHPMPWRVKLAYAIDANGNTVLDDHGYAPDPRQLFDALATALRAALADQRRYQWLRASGLVVLDESVTVADNETLYPGAIADSYVDKVCDAALTADGGGV